MDVIELEARSIFMAALDHSPDEWPAFLDRECHGNAAIKARLQRLLAAHRESGSIHDEDVDPLCPTLHEFPGTEALGTQIGPYMLREVLGEGGMGIVYAAEQERPIRRRVALKVIKPGMDTREVVARFEAERQALAQMDHPNIAKVLDAGATEAGRPYFVMELVRGMPLTTYSDEARLPLRERLKLFITVCQAVQHAHQKGIIHRDLKPSNVMVTLHDGVPVPKIIDFGVAKALNQRLTDQSVYTKVAQLLGTPMYMSPEQAELSGLDVDIRSDVYSLGVLLYELLTGQTPFDKEAFSKLGYDQVLRMIREAEPPRPSARISTLAGENRSTVTSQRGIDDRHLARTLRGELDWIVMKALEKDRTRRYGSADALAADVQRYLDDQPVQACPPSVGYRLQKLVWRKRSTISAVFLTLLFGLLLAAVIVVVKDRAGSEVAVTSDEGAVKQGSTNPPPLIVAPGRTLLGLVPQPALFPDVGPWQLISRGPRSFVNQNWTLAWSPDSQHIVLGDGTDVRIYAVPSLELERVCTGHESSVVGVDWSPNGRHIASCSLDNTVRLWDAQTGVPGPVLVGHRDRVDAVAWHPDSEKLASGSRDFTVRVWNKDGTTGPVLRGHTDHVYSVAWNHHGSKLATASPDGTIRIWDSDGNAERVINTKHSQRTVEWLPNDQQVLTAQFEVGTAEIWNLDGTPGVEFKGHTGSVTQAALSPDGSQVASASWDDTVRLWSIDGTSGPTLTGFRGNAYSVAWSPDGRWIAAAGVDRAIRLFRADGERGPELRGSLRFVRTDWNHDGRQFAASVSDRTIRIYNADGQQQTVLEVPATPALAFDWKPDGQQIAAAYKDGTVRIWNVADGRMAIQFAPSSGELNVLAWHPRLPRIALAADGAPICLCNLDGSLVPGWERGHPGVLEVAWNPVDDELASVGSDGKLRLWSLNDAPDSAFTSGELLTAIAWKPDGTQLASGSGSGAIQLWHHDGRPGTLLKGHSDWVTSVAWSTDGLWIASGSRDNTVRIWGMDGTTVAVLRGHLGQVESVRWQPHSSQLLSSSSDGIIRLWTIKSDQPEWSCIALGDKQSVKFDAAGRVLSGDPELFEREFAYMVEQPTGAIEILAASEFNRRIKQAQ